MDILETNFLHTLGVPNIYQKNHFLKAKFNKKSETTEVKNLKFLRYENSIYEVVHLYFWSCMWFVADAQKTEENLNT